MMELRVRITPALLLDERGTEGVGAIVCGYSETREFERRFQGPGYRTAAYIIRKPPGRTPAARKQSIG
jgi:hypothetical protein